MSDGILTLLLFGSMLLVVLSGLPITFALGGLAVVFILFLEGPTFLTSIVMNTYAGSTSYLLVAVPLFIFMSSMLEKSGIADDLFEVIQRWVGGLRGGLAVGTVIMSIALAAMVGISAASTAILGLIALPAMLKRGYDKEIALGSIQAGGALGVLIPPSVLMIIIALFGQLSVGRLFIGGIIPGLLLGSLFIIYILVRCTIQPHLGPSIPPAERANWTQRISYSLLLILPVGLILGVMACIFGGIATVTEAAAVGALCSILIPVLYTILGWIFRVAGRNYNRQASVSESASVKAMYNHFLKISEVLSNRFSWQKFKEACYGTLRISCMIMWIIIGAKCFTSVYMLIGAQNIIHDVLIAVPGGAWATLIVMLVILIVMGCFLDPGAITMVTIPIFIPMVDALGFDTLWFGILFVIIMEMGYLTPPFGMNLFVMKGVVPEGITMGDIYRSITPFVALQAVGLIIIMLFPQLATWLPSLMFD